MHSRTRFVLALSALAVVFAAATALLDFASGVKLVVFQQAPLRLLLGSMPGLVLAALLFALTRRAALSVVLALLLQALLYGVNALKMANLGAPLLPVDFYLAGELTQGASRLLGSYLPRTPWPYLALLATLVVVVALARWEPPLLGRRSKALRISTAAASGVILITLVVGTWPWPQVYNPQRMRMQPWSAVNTIRTSGLVNSLLLFHLHFGVTQDTPDRDAARRLVAQHRAALDRYMRQPVARPAHPDIVVIQSESFFDPAIMNGYQDAGANPNLHRLARRGTSGLMHVPTFGGGTIRTEFEVLTGMPLRYLGGVQFPYLQLDQPRIPGLVQVLDEHGYATTAIHGASPEVWNRVGAFRRMGFDRFLSRADFPADAATDGRYMADKAMTDRILARLDGLAADAPPQFIFAISIEAHGAYDVSPGLDRKVRDAIRVPASVTDPEAKIELRNYLHHMRNADAELGRLVAALDKRRRPTIVVFYGDHLPGLLRAFAQTGFVDGRGYREQQVPWLMLETHRPRPPEHVDTAAWLLPGRVLERAGIRDAPYFALTRIVGQSLARYTRPQNAPPVAIADAATRSLDREMANLNRLRLRAPPYALIEPAQLKRGFAQRIWPFPPNAGAPAETSPAGTDAYRKASDSGF